MSIQDIAGNNKKTLLFNNQNVLDSKIDMLTAMMIKLTTESDNQSRPF